MTDDMSTREPLDLPGSMEDGGLSWVARAVLFSTAFVLLPIILIVLLLAAVFIVRLLVPFEGESAPAFEAVTTTLIVEVALIGLIAILVRGFYQEPLLKGLRWSREYVASGGRLVLLGVALAATGMVVSTVFPPDDTAMQELFRTPQAIVLLAIVSVVAAPFLEEVVFRGFYYRVLEDVAGTGAAVFGTAILFAAMHALQLWPSWPAILMILAVGLALAWLRWRTRSLIPSFLVHTAYNSTLVLVTVLSALAGIE